VKSAGFALGLQDGGTHLGQDVAAADQSPRVLVHLAPHEGRPVGALLPHDLGDALHTVERGVRADDQELVPAQPTRHVVASDRVLDVARELTNDDVSRVVTIGVVDVLELVRVDHHARERGARPLRLVP